MSEVTFAYFTGLRRPLFQNARLSGSWDTSGREAERWTIVPMEEFTAEDGCPAFRATVTLDDSQVGRAFRWGVVVDTEHRVDVWGISTEVNDITSFGRLQRYRGFTLQTGGQTQRFYLTH